MMFDGKGVKRCRRGTLVKSIAYVAALSLRTILVRLDPAIGSTLSYLIAPRGGYRDLAGPVESS